MKIITITTNNYIRESNMIAESISTTKLDLDEIRNLHIYPYGDDPSKGFLQIEMKNGTEHYVKL